MITFVNCSPKLKNSNSKCFIEDIIKNINEDYNIAMLYKDEFKYIFDLINKSDKIVLVFPLYVDAPPSKLLEFFEYVDDLKFIKNICVYAISQCGFLEAKHNDVAIKIIQCFCINNKLKFMGALKIGAGEVLGDSNLKKYKMLNYDYYNKMQIFSYNLELAKQISLDTTIKFVGIVLYTIFANMYWYKEIKRHK